ncbi:MAG: cobalt transporter CbiM [Rhodospirillaceae bacterium]|nr:cobalt transporter CbiM [Rhodospirillaceae bacterium]
MAHIPDGVLSPAVLAGGGILAAGGLAAALRHLDEARIARTAILAAVFFAASLIVVPVGPSSVHLLLGALMGLVIGTATFPAVLIALVLQAVLFGFGGLTTLGVNTFNIALPGVLFGLLAHGYVGRAQAPAAMLAAGAAAAAAVAGTAGLVALALILSSADFVQPAKVLGLTYLPLMLAEALITGFAVGFLKRVKPEIFLASARPVAA